VRFLQTEERLEAHHALISLLSEQGKVSEAVAYLERARSKQLLDALRLRSLTVPDPNLRQLLARTEALELALSAQERARLAEISLPEAEQDKTKVANLVQLAAGTRAELLQVTNRIRDANPDYERFVTVKATDLKTIQKRLPADVVVVEYLPLETALTVFLVTSGETRAAHVAVSRKRLDELTAVLRREVRLAQQGGGASVLDWDWRSQRARPLRDALTALYAYLIAPIQRDIARARTLVVLPSGSLFYLPFQTLAREMPDGSLRFFGEDKEVAVLTSLQLWEQITAESGGANRARGRLGAFGNPDGTLPAAEAEVKRLGALFERSIVYTGAEATRTRVESLPADVSRAHFATHGRLDEQDINECYLTLAGGEKLKLGEVYGLAGKYPAKLTILSACETGLGRKDPGNEVAHLANGFVEAGSTAIIASLWQVSDASTAALMERLYRELGAGKSLAQSKRAAEIELLRTKQTAHPYFWAPFVLIGDWR
jgi:CHAT domain-containing protein